MIIDQILLINSVDSQGPDLLNSHLCILALSFFLVGLVLVCHYIYIEYYISGKLTNLFRKIIKSNFMIIKGFTISLLSRVLGFFNSKVKLLGIMTIYMCVRNNPLLAIYYYYSVIKLFILVLDLMLTLTGFPSNLYVMCLNDGLGNVSDDTLESVVDMFEKAEEEYRQKESANSASDNSSSTDDSGSDSASESSNEHQGHGTFQIDTPGPDMARIDTLIALTEFWLRIPAEAPIQILDWINNIDRVIVEQNEAIQNGTSSPFAQEFISTQTAWRQHLVTAFSTFTDRTDHNNLRDQFIDLVQSGSTQQQAYDALGFNV